MNMRYEVYDRCNRMIGVNSFCGCYCYGGIPSDGWSKRVLLIFSIDELKYDIANVAFSQGKAVETDEKGTPDERKNSERQLDQWMTVCEDGNFDRVKRQMSVAVSECESKLFLLTKSYIGKNTSMDDSRRQNQEYLVELRVNDYFSESSVVALLNFIHDYIVARVLEDWSGVCVRPDFMEYWRSRRMELMELIGKEGNRSNSMGDARIAASWC